MNCARSLWIILWTGTAVAQPAPDPPALAGRPIERVELRGIHRIEDDAIRSQLRSRPGTPLETTALRDDLRAMWKLGAFAAVDVEAELAASGGVALTFAVAEKPAIRKVVVAGHGGLGLDKINDVLDLERGAIVDLSKVRRNRDKIVDLYLQHGFYLASVGYEIVPAGDAEVDVAFQIDERGKVRIRDLQFIGNHAISDDELRASIATRRPGALAFLDGAGTFRQDVLERDLAVVAAHYLDRGYASVKVGTPALRLSRDKQSMYVSIPIDEGPVFTFGVIDVRGDLIGSPAQHLARIGARPGQTFSRARFEEDRHKLASYYQDQGYAYANVVPRSKLDLPGRRVELVFEIARGKRAYFDRINIRGNSKTRDKVIRREMTISEGELFSNTNLEVSRRRISALGFFDNVVVSTRRGSSDDLVEVDVEVSERPTGTFQIGAGFSSVETFIAQAQISQNNLFGRGQSLALQAQISALRRLFLLRFVEPYFLDTRWRFSFELYNQSRGLGTFSRDASGGTLTWGYPLSYEAAAFLTYKLEDVSISSGSGGIANLGATSAPIASTNVANLWRGGVTSSLRASLSWDSRNNRLFPTGGWYATAFAEYASQYTGSENKFLRWGGFARHYRHLWGPFTLRLNAEIGVTTSLDRRGVPISERYMLGGMYDIRGYGPRSLGPRFSTQVPGDVGHELDDNQPLGGNLQLIWNSEIEFPLARKLGISGVVFFDMGNTFNLEDRYCAGARGATPAVAATVDPCFDLGSIAGGLRKSVGLGIRWASPLGPLRFEWGIPLDLRGDEKPAGLEFTIGTFF